MAEISGYSFLYSNQETQHILIPDTLSEEQKMFRDSAKKFMQQEVLPHIEQLESKDYNFQKDLLAKAGQLGLLGAEIPEQYGGLELDLLSIMTIGEEIAAQPSFSVTMGAHTGIGTHPVLYFGNDEQKAKYLPKMASGEWISSYCLTEPSSGSDALAAKTKAVLSEDGSHYVLNGSKMWITNGGFANLGMVFAQVDGTQFSCFIVETNSEGYEPAAEEKKMGLHGSSTTAISIDNVKVPKENLIGEVGQGHKVALNVLNMGRLKLGAWCTATAKTVIKQTLDYALERVQFGQHIAHFGAIQNKLGRMIALAWVANAAVYRTAGNIHHNVGDNKESSQYLKVLHDFAGECAIVKVACSEILDYIVDEGVQCFGGYGYSGEYPAERSYRDSRINRLFEGTNEINRLTTAGMLLKQIAKGRFPLADFSQALESGESLFIAPNSDLFPREWAVLTELKHSFLVILEQFVVAFGHDKPDQKHQELMELIANISIEIYLQESALLRCEKLIEDQGVDKLTVEPAIVEAFNEESRHKTLHYLDALLAELIAHEPANHLTARKFIQNLQTRPPIPTIHRFRRIALAGIEKKGYPTG